jgi:hypothetical protein
MEKIRSVAAPPSIVKMFALLPEMFKAPLLVIIISLASVIEVIPAAKFTVLSPATALAD